MHEKATNAIIAGAGSGLGAALARELAQRSGYRVFALARRNELPALRHLTWLPTDLTDPASVANSLSTVADQAPQVHLLITCVGVLHGGGTEQGLGPEKSLRQLDADNFHHVMSVNALAPLQILGACAPLLRHDQRAVAATLSAMVGSIGENRLGGWYSYRMSKAALNMGLKNAAIELSRPATARRRGPIVTAIHPGTTRTALSAPFLGQRSARPPEHSAAHILRVIDKLSPADNGKFLNWDGRELPW
jgi:NAD(P)-dependent dehydrogenase (short-subunit alcohol dehydrogenase family)